MTIRLTPHRYSSAIAVIIFFMASGGHADDSIVPTSGSITGLPAVSFDYTWPDAELPADYYPVTVHSCGEGVTFEAAPERAVVNDDNMIELMFALGLTEHMSAYSAAGPRLRLAAFKDDYAAVTSLGDDYFKLEPLLGANPDFVFSGWNYGFSEDGVSPAILADFGINSYVLNESCRRINNSLTPATIDEWYDDVRNIGTIFGVPDRAEALIAHWEGRLARVAERLPDTDPVPVFSYGFGDDAPGGGLGLTIVSELYRRAGAINVFEDLLEMWGSVSWEAFVDAKPEFIVITDYGSAGAGQSGDEKMAFLSSVDGIDEVPAIANQRYLVLPQEAVNPGIRIIDGIEALAADLYPAQFADLVGTPGFGLSPTSD
ncbi:ABC transporter substrate-binding protein [Granulosicoccus antarcticus]|uniref:Vitamin B12-binding protein n=1 Tax=Granulosicoccus antarcticus IMCC3135 TaxID=1192854 RepID=A0A2Z2NXR8_9GAMM|nr:ABC transporter substrate-binding protein [Granulosicoccus antarcticus]ASJ74771.1 Vitamin B12-binding protein [Granulosicoccus antarcticus IMCC3135]